MKNRLKELREQRHLYQKDIATMLDIAVSTYSYWEKGTYEPDQKSLAKLADFFGVSVDYLLGREPSKNEKCPTVRDARSDIAENFVKEFGELFTDEAFIKTARLYKLMTAAQRLMILGVIIGHMEKAGIDIPPMLR